MRQDKGKRLAGKHKSDSGRGAAKRPRVSTRTSSFGVSKREGHDSSKFYGSKLYQALAKPKMEAEGGVNTIPPPAANKVFCASSEVMRELPDNCVHLMVTSPPYNVGKEYDEDLSLKEYLGLLGRVFKEVYRVLVPGGRACVNVANVGRKPYLPLHLFVTEVMLEAGFVMRGEVIWDKSASAGTSTAWGSWCSPANPTLRDVHEYLLIFSKGEFGREHPAGRKGTITSGEFLKFTKSIWAFSAASARKIGHPAPFPMELPRRLIELYTFSGEVVLDPFMGSGQTAIAAIETGRVYTGYERDAGYHSLCEKRIAEYQPKQRAQE